MSGQRQEKHSEWNHTISSSRQSHEWGGFQPEGRAAQTQEQQSQACEWPILLADGPGSVREEAHSHSKAIKSNARPRRLEV